MKRYRRITAEQLNAALATIAEREGHKVSPEDLAKLVNADERRARRWTEGQEDIPHHVALLLGLFLQMPGAYKLAKAINTHMFTGEVA